MSPGKKCYIEPEIKLIKNRLNPAGQNFFSGMLERVQKGENVYFCVNSMKLANIIYDNFQFNFCWKDLTEFTNCDVAGIIASFLGKSQKSFIFFHRDDSRTLKERYSDVNKNWKKNS